MMFGGLVRANENHRDVPAVSPLEFRILINIHFPQCGAKFIQQRLHERLRVLAEMAAWARIKRYLKQVSGGHAQIFGMVAHGLGFEYFWKGPV